MRILSRSDQSLAAAREELRTLAEETDQLPDALVERLIQGLQRGWLVNYSEQPQPDELFAVGASKFGGRPDVGAGWTWPIGKLGIPLGFLLQLNLADIDLSADGYPSDGLLSLYWCPGTEDGLVQYAPPGSALSRFQGAEPEQDPLMGQQLCYPPAVMLLREHRWMTPLIELFTVRQPDGCPGMTLEEDEFLSRPEVTAYYERCTASTETPEDGAWDYHDSLLLFASGSLSHMSSFDVLPDQRDWRLIFDLTFFDRPPFGECYTDHNICYQMMIRAADLHQRRFSLTEFSSAAEG
jgi:Domain of unknown function (DUF1963)